MKVYETNKIKNVCLVGHGGSGKTSLLEAIMYNIGTIKRKGKVEDRNTISDYLPEETKRQISINLALAPVEWKNYKINLLDSPGYSDFMGEVVGALEVAESLIFTICASSGIEVQTEIIWNYANKKDLPRIIYINKMDRENADFYRVLNELDDKFKDKLLVPLTIPIGKEDSFKGIVNILSQKTLIFENDSGKYETTQIPSKLLDKAELYRTKLIEASVENDDELLMKYLEGELLEIDEIKKGLKIAINSDRIVPILCGSTKQNIGLEQLLDIIVDYLPSPTEKNSETKNEFSTLVFKTLTDLFVGKISYLKVLDGTLKTDSSVYNILQECEEKITQLNLNSGKTQIPIKEAKAGDIVAVTKLQNTLTGDILALRNSEIANIKEIKYPNPNLIVAIRPKSKGDEEKLSNAINRLLEEDLTIAIEKNRDTKETLLKTMGEIHIDIIKEKLFRKFGVEVMISNPKVPYKETIRIPVSKVEGKHKKQSGGHGQYGHVYIDVEPIKDNDFEFAEKVFGGSVPRQYIPGVEKGIRDAMVEGILAGFPVSNIKVTLIDGSYHPVDSSEMSFKIAASIAFKHALEKAKPILLEPVMNVKIEIPDEFMGDIMGDLNTKRGKILGMEPNDDMQIIRAIVPLAEMYRYIIDLKSITQGKGNFTMEFAKYEEVPDMYAEKIIEARINSKMAKSS